MSQFNFNSIRNHADPEENWTQPPRIWCQTWKTFSPANTAVVLNKFQQQFLCFIDFPPSVFLHSGSSSSPYLNKIDSFWKSYHATKPQALNFCWGLGGRGGCPTIPLWLLTDGLNGWVAESRTVVAGGVVWGKHAGGVVQRRPPTGPMDLLCLGPCDVLCGAIVVSHNLGKGEQVSVNRRKVRKRQSRRRRSHQFHLSCSAADGECGRGSWESFLFYTKPPTCFSDGPVHVGIFSSSILRARSIYAAANYRRSSAVANYLESLARVLETQTSTALISGMAGVDSAFLFLCYRPMAVTKTSCIHLTI